MFRRISALLGLVALLAAEPVSAQTSGLAAAWCGTARPLDLTEPDAPAPRVQAFVAHPPGATFDAAYWGARLHQTLAGVHARVVAASGGRKGLRIRTGGSGCTSAHVDVVEIVLRPETKTLAGAVSDVREQTRDVPMTLWAGVGLGVTHPGDAAGYGGSLSLNQSAPPTPAHDEGLDGRAGAIWSSTADVNIAAHEVFHALGAVSANAPNGQAGHITGPSQQQDLMGLGSVIDPGHDDYFNPNGPITGRDGSGVWNTYDSFFLCAVERCLTPPDRPVVGLTGSARDATGARFTASGASFYRWYVNGNYQEGQAGGAFDSTFNTSVSVRGFSPGGEASDLATLTVAPPAFVRPPSQPVMPTPSTSAGEEETWIPASEAPPASLAMSAKAPSLGTLARQGLLVTVRSPRDGQVTVRAVVKSPRRHGLRTAVLATRTVTVRAGVPASVRLKPTTAVAKRLRTNRVYPLRVELDSRQAGVSAKTVTLRVTRR